MKEIWDAWGRPIEFLRWPAGFTKEQAGEDLAWGNAGNDDDGQNGADDLAEFKWQGSDDFELTMTTQTINAAAAPDPFDPVKVSLSLGGYAMRPLIMSSGRDREFDIITAQLPTDVHYSPPSPTGNNAPNPYVSVTTKFKGNQISVRIGTPGDWDDDGADGYADNITNHFVQTP